MIAFWPKDDPHRSVRASGLRYDTSGAGGSLNAADRISLWLAAKKKKKKIPAIFPPLPAPPFRVKVLKSNHRLSLGLVDVFNRVACRREGSSIFSNFNPDEVK